MTQAPQQAQAAASAPAPAAPATAPVGPASVTSPAVATRARATQDVPSLLNRWQAIAVAACVLFAVLTAALQLLGWQANRAAADNTEQLVRVQNIQSTLFRADALATTSFLVGGLERPEQRQDYEDAIDQVTRQIAEAARAQPADSEVLAALNSAVNRFTTTNTQARDNNRQGFPVGAEYLRGASSQLRDEAQPLIAALTTANSQRAEDELGGQHPLLMILPGLVALTLLWWVNTQLAAVFRRRFNIGIAAAFAVVAALTLIGTGVSSNQNNANDDLRDGSYRVAVNEATARTAANDAKSNESRRLGAQGSGAVFEEGWVAAANRVEDNASRETLPLWQAYSDLHFRVVDLEESGKYDDAVELATTVDESGPTAALDTFDEASQSLVATMAAQTTDSLRSGNGLLLVLAVLSLLLGLGAAGLSTWGIAQRRKEYA
ncbi:hypothetical protein [Nocardioides currus]|uniref:Chemotaxis methyl-accepting receptor HlyB-like 4HB MCP domain-containing protein n=1 Tax=Nocardioides currus TaxID=2133958 RepID=A0A2R7YU71_9ACTN|nr:hypothetical protein [Nocardioides currus]PUA79925.1 hypothetical protein C7S10_15270 [Nocardioides currus]